MMELFRAGGFSMFGVVAFGLAALVAAALFARGPRPERLGFIASMAFGTAFMSLAGTVSDLAKVFTFVPSLVTDGKLDRAQLPLIVMQGISESMSPMIFGFTLLALVGFTCAVGFRRLNRAALPA